MYAIPSWRDLFDMLLDPHPKPKRQSFLELVAERDALREEVRVLRLQLERNARVLEPAGFLTKHERSKR